MLTSIASTQVLNPDGTKMDGVLILSPPAYRTGEAPVRVVSSQRVSAQITGGSVLALVDAVGEPEWKLSVWSADGLFVYEETVVVPDDGGVHDLSEFISMATEG